MQIETLAQGDANLLRSQTAAPERVKRDRQSATHDAPPQPADKRVAPEEILKRIKELTEGGAHSVRFEMDPEINVLVIRMYDSKTEELIRQIPAESLLETARSLQEYRRGLIVDDRG